MASCCSPARPKILRFFVTRTLHAPKRSTAAPNAPTCCTGSMPVHCARMTAHTDEHRLHTTLHLAQGRHRPPRAACGVERARHMAPPLRRPRRVSTQHALEGDGLQLLAASRPRQSTRAAAASCLHTRTAHGPHVAPECQSATKADHCALLAFERSPWRPPVALSRSRTR